MKVRHAHDSERDLDVTVVLLSQTEAMDLIRSLADQILTLSGPRGRLPRLELQEGGQYFSIQVVPSKKEEKDPFGFPPDNKAKELGATVEGGINWTWAKNFPSPEKGKEFVAWLAANGYEHRGYCPADPGSSNENLRTDGVRYR